MMLHLYYNKMHAYIHETAVFFLNNIRDLIRPIVHCSLQCLQRTRFIMRVLQKLMFT